MNVSEGAGSILVERSSHQPVLMPACRCIFHCWSTAHLDLFCQGKRLIFRPCMSKALLALLCKAAQGRVPMHKPMLSAKKHNPAAIIAQRSTMETAQPAWHSRAQRSTVQHSTAQHGTARHGMARHRTAQRRKAQSTQHSTQWTGIAQTSCSQA